MGVIWVDGDGCPKNVIAAVETLAEEYGWSFKIVANIHHNIVHPSRIVVDDQDQSTDLYIVNRLRQGDIVVTQDIGLAAISMARSSSAIHVSGHIYKPDEMSYVLELRAHTAKMRRAGKRSKGPSKRTSIDDSMFYQSLESILNQNLNKTNL